MNSIRSTLSVLARSLFLLRLAQLVCASGQLTISATAPSDSITLSFQDWQYREISARSGWFLGCWSYDFLQGTGWYPSTWYQYIEPQDDQTDPSKRIYSVDRTARASYCNAQPDEYNYLDIQYTNNETGLVLDGFVRVYPSDSDQVGDSISVRCAPAGVIESPCTSCGLTCEEAHLKWDGRGTAEVSIVWEEPEESIDQSSP